MMIRKSTCNSKIPHLQANKMQEKCSKPLSAYFRMLWSIYPRRSSVANNVRKRTSYFYVQLLFLYAPIREVSSAHGDFCTLDCEFPWGSGTSSGSCPCVALPQETTLVQEPPLQQKGAVQLHHNSRWVKCAEHYTCLSVDWGTLNHTLASFHLIWLEQGKTICHFAEAREFSVRWSSTLKWMHLGCPNACTPCFYAFMEGEALCHCLWPLTLLYPSFTGGRYWQQCLHYMNPHRPLK